MAISERLTLLVINGGSSSIKFAIYHGAQERQLYGEIKRIGSKETSLSVTWDNEQSEMAVKANDFNEASVFLVEWLEKQSLFKEVACIGHRIVHGMQHTRAEVITDELLEELDKIAFYDPDHLPAEISLVQLFKNKHPDLLQVACFDTAFHAGMPAVAKLQPIPRRYQQEGVQKYGFHGLSYTYLMDELEKTVGEKAASGRIILAHLGSGASMVAVSGGKSIDTTMGFTPTGGMVMGTRTGDIDPGVAWYIMLGKDMTAEKFNHIINHESGMLGMSETSADMQDLLKAEENDPRAADAVALFCYSARKWIGALTAVLGGIDMLVFSGGIGEHAAPIRSRICDGLDYLGIAVDEEQNGKHALVISQAGAAIQVYVIPTNEEIIIAQATAELFNKGQIKKQKFKNEL